MAFTLDDLLERLGLQGKRENREIIREEAANFQTADRDKIKELFPNVTLSESKEVMYVPFRLCHSLPKINARGRFFTAKTLSNSYASVRDAIVNVDHQMAFRNKARDTICGHIVCGRFDPENLLAQETASTKMPKAAIPVLALSAFYMRGEFFPSLLEEHFSGKRKWLASMECSHKWDEAAFLYRGDLIPLKDAPSGMLECVSDNAVKPFKNFDLALGLGGENGKVDFHAAGLTPAPADGDCDLIAFVTKDEYVEAANRGDNPFFFPLERKIFVMGDGKTDQQELSSSDEMANIVVIGQTKPAEDGHSHDVLSDGTVMPAGGHTHCLATWGLIRGTNPRFTGRTDTHYDYVPVPPTSPEYSDRYRERSVAHIHLVDIPLRGKVSSGTTTDANDATGSEAASVAQDVLAIQKLFAPVSLFVEKDMKVQDLLARVGQCLSSGKFEGTAAQEVASLKDVLTKFSLDEAIKEAVKTEIANQVTAGTIVTKEVHDKAVADAAAAEKAKADAAAKEAEARTIRREKVIALGVDLESPVSDKNKMTVGEYVNSFPLGEAGDASFDVALTTLEAAIKKVDPPAEPVTTPAADGSATTTVPTGTQTVAANTGGKPATPAKAKKPILAVGGGSPDADDLASDPNKPAKPTKKVGKALFSTPLA